MSGCSLVAAGLPSLIGTATPTFSYDVNRHPLLSGDQFGIQMTYMSGASTCYQGTRPTFTPIISNPLLLYTRTCSYVTQGAPATYTGIFCNNADLWNWINAGAYTIDNYQFLNLFAVTPQAFTATFGTQPAPSTVATFTVPVTSTTTSTAIAIAVPAATTTVTSASATSTFTNLVTVPFPVTSPFTQLITSCPTSSPSPVLPGLSTPILPSLSVPIVSTPILPPLSTPVVSIPIVSTPIVSSLATPVVSIPVVSTPVLSIPVVSTPIIPSLSTPVVSIPVVSTPVVSVPVISTPVVSVPVISTPVVSIPVISSPVVSIPVISTPIVSIPITSSLSVPILPSLSTPVVPLPSASGLSCPASDGKTFSTSQGNFIVECFVDRFDSDIGIAPNNPATYEQCIQACASTTGCQAVAYIPNGPCYLKNGIGAPFSNGNVWGARIANVPVASSSMVSTSSTRSSSPVVSTTVVTASPSASASCPGSNGAVITTNGRQYLVECGSDYTGGDIPGPMSPTYPSSYEKCLADCSSTTGCVAVSYVIGGPCYLKNAVSGARTNSNIIGGRLVGIVSTSAAASATPAPGPSTVTVTTTISNTGYQCACTPASVFSSTSSAPAATPTSAVSCPGSNGSTFMTSCGALYAVECASDRFGNDLTNGLVYTDTYEQCLQACDRTTGCVNVSWVIGKPGACYMKGSIGAIRENSNIIGGRKLSGCSTLKLHRKRVAVAAPKHKLAKRAGFFGPDFTFTQDRVTATATVTIRTTVSTTTTPIIGIATQTAFTLASATVTATTSVPTTVFNMVMITTCPVALPALPTALPALPTL